MFISTISEVNVTYISLLGYNASRFARNCPPCRRPQVSFMLGTAHLTEDQSLLLLGTAPLTEDPRILLLFRNWPTLPGEAEYVLAEDPAGEEDGETVAVQLVPDHHVVIHKQKTGTFCPRRKV